jgi:hypothetical protein
MLEVRRATPDDIDFVIGHLWRRGEQEYAEWGVGRRELFDRYQQYGREAHSYCIRDEEPIALMGAMQFGEGYYRTWFQATERFADVGKEITVLVRKFMREQVADHPGAVVDLVTATQHPDAHRWFRLLGFRPHAMEDGSRVYRYTVGS